MEGVSVIELPVPTDAPKPHPPSYHLKFAPPPSTPPTWVRVMLFPAQILLNGALLVAEVGAVEADCIVTLNEHVEFPHVFVAVQVTTVVPLLKVLPEEGEQETVAAGVPVAVGSVQAAIEVH